jgi:hypothetical protein
MSNRPSKIAPRSEPSGSAHGCSRFSAIAGAAERADSRSAFLGQSVASLGLSLRQSTSRSLGRFGAALFEALRAQPIVARERLTHRSGAVAVEPAPICLSQAIRFAPDENHSAEDIRAPEHASFASVHVLVDELQPNPWVTSVESAVPSPASKSARPWVQGISHTGEPFASRPGPSCRCSSHRAWPATTYAAGRRHSPRPEATSHRRRVGASSAHAVFSFRGIAGLPRRLSRKTCWMRSPSTRWAER